MSKVKHIIAIVVATVVIFVGVVLLIDFSKHRIIEREYFEKASVYSPHYFYFVKERKGEPIEEKWEYLPDGDPYRVLVYDGYRYVGGEVEHTDYFRDYSVRYIDITDPSYRIGSRKVGIGSTRKEIESAYTPPGKRIKGLDENEIGFVDGTTWVTFSLSQNDEVTKIQIISNGP